MTLKQNLDLPCVGFICDCCTVDGYRIYPGTPYNTIVMSRCCLAKISDVLGANDIDLAPCFSSSEVQISISDDDFFVSGLACSQLLPTITWTLNTACGGDSINESLTYYVALEYTFDHFNTELAGKLGVVDTPLVKNGHYFTCDTSGFYLILPCDNYGGLSANVDPCDARFDVTQNQTAGVSTGRKKLNFSGSSSTEKSSLTEPCRVDTFFWVATPNNSANCIFFDTAFLFITIDLSAPTFTNIPPDFTIPAGTPALFDVPTVEDNCVVPILTYTDEIAVSGCDTSYTRTWVASDSCQFSTASQTITKISPLQPQLQLIPDSFPPNLVEILGDTLLIDSCFQFSGLVFDTSDVEVSGNCDPNLQITMDLNPDNPDEFFQDVSCPDELPTVTWYGIINDAGVPDTVATLSYKVAERSKFFGFSNQLAALLNVSAVQAGAYYQACDTSLFDNPLINEFASFQNCNANVGVSTGRKKLNFSGGNAPVEKSFAPLPCDTFQITWTPIDTVSGDTCQFTESVSIFLIVDEQAPVFTAIPADTVIEPGSLVVFGTPDVGDNCTAPDLTFTDGLQVAGSDSIYSRTWTADDGCQTTTATQTITIKALRLDCPGDLTVIAPPGATGTTVNWLPPQASTPCDSGSTDCQPENIPGFNVLGELNGKAYYISTTEKNWTDARTHCEANGGQLAIADTPEKNSFLTGGIGFFNAAYIGLSDRDSEGNFTWLNGEPLTYQNWEPGQPDGGADQHYVAMHGWNNGRWADYHFWTAKKYLLEKSCTGNSGLNIAQTEGLASGSFFPLGGTVITYQATDACGNSAACSFTVAVEQDGGGSGCDENLALNTSAQQSSTRDGGVAVRAVDGNTSGNFWLDFSVSHTDWEDYPWWEADLTKKKFIEQINLWNRTDCCAQHLSGLYVLVSDEPFVSYDLDEVLAQAGVSAFFIQNQVGLPGSVAVNRSGRYVRVQMNKQSFLALAEVEVLGCDEGPDIAAPAPSNLFFDASLMNGKEVALRWMENSSADKAYFTIEKSTDRHHFEVLFDQLEPKTNGTGNPYLQYDLRPEDGDNFYRLKSVLKNGSVEYSPIRKVKFNPDEDFTVFPNPASDRAFIYLERFSGKEVKVLISNAFGQPVFEQSFDDLQEAVLNIDLRRQGIRGGVYFVSVIHRGRAVTKRLVVSSPD